MTREEAKDLERGFIKMMIDHAGPKDWPGDFHMENGNYQCYCVECHDFFQGYKRRAICRECDSKYVHLRCHDCKYVRMVPKETGLWDEVLCNVCEVKHRRSWWIELPEGSR